MYVSKCLNPCSNGIWSLTALQETSVSRLHRLNPCSNGIWSLTSTVMALALSRLGLNPCSNGIWSLTQGDHRRTECKAS